MLAVGTGGSYADIFPRLSYLSRYRLKLCFKWPLNPKTISQSQQKWHRNPMKIQPWGNVQRLQLQLLALCFKRHYFESMFRFQGCMTGGNLGAVMV